MRCQYCGAQNNVEIKNKIYCASCGHLIYTPTKVKNKELILEENIMPIETRVIESQEIIHSPAIPNLEEEMRPQVREVSFKPFFFIATFILFVVFVILTFVFEPFINLRAMFFKYAQPVSELDFFKKKVKSSIAEAQKLDPQVYLVLVDLGKGSFEEFTSFPTKDTYSCIFVSPNKHKEMLLVFVHQKQEKIVGIIKLHQKEVARIYPDQEFNAIQIEKVKYLANEIFPIVQINGLDNFLENYPEAFLKKGPLLSSSSKDINYWFYFYETKDHKHKFEAKVNAETGKILAVSQR